MGNIRRGYSALDASTRKQFFAVLLLVAMVFLLSPFSRNVQAESEGRKIIIWRENVSETRRSEVLARATRIKDLALVRASVVEGLSDAQAEALLSSGEALRVDNDPVAYTLARDVRIEREARASARRSSGGDAQALAQSLPWGIDRIDAELVWPTGNTANPVKIGVIDTGISTKHPDLKPNLKGGVNTIRARSGYNDDNGHGSHVAGIIAAASNTQGVVGAAPEADLYAIKVLSASGSGYYSDIIEGVEWAINNNMQVINMSLGGSTDYAPLHDALIAAKNAGIVIVAAAGNSGGAVGYPAAYPEVIAVAATDSANTRASWSSYGPAVDVSAPGVSIYSTYKGTGYATMSGTSMAAPHVAGAAALLLNAGVAASDVQARLQNTASDLGSAGYDTYYGFGLINAFSAL